MMDKGLQMKDKHYETQKFENLDISGETFENHKFIDCEFNNCTFEECKIVRCSFSGCTFHKCTIRNLQATYSQMQYGEFIDCRLISINWSELLPNSRIADPISKMQACSLKYNTFTDMHLNKFDFSGTEISDSMFAECQLVESNFSSCQLKRTEFFRCDIQKSDFRQAANYQIDIMTCKMRGARFSFPEVVGLLNGLDINID